MKTTKTMVATTMTSTTQILKAFRGAFSAVYAEMEPLTDVHVVISAFCRRITPPLGYIYASILDLEKAGWSDVESNGELLGCL